MVEISEQIKAGLEAKVRGIETALNYVKDPRERDRLSKELSGAQEALKKLCEGVTRSPEEAEKVEKAFCSDVDVEAPKSSWADMTPIDKFRYQVDLYADRLKNTLKDVERDCVNLKKVVSHLNKTKGDSAVFMDPVIKQFVKSLRQVEFSEDTIRAQLALEEDVYVLIGDVEFFSKLTLLCKFLNNPMSLPHLAEEYDKRLGDLNNEFEKM